MSRRTARARPRTTYEAQFSLPFSVAAAFVDGHVGVDTTHRRAWATSGCWAWLRGVRYAIDADSRFPATFPGWVRVRLTDGRTVEARAEDGHGGLARPLSRQAIVQKFRGNAGRALAPSQVDALEHAALGFERLGSVASILAMCRA